MLVATDTALIPQLQSQFVELLPKIELHARIFFRDVRCAAQKADRIAECVALCWQWFVRLARQGRDAREWVSTLASFAARAVRSGRRLCGRHKAQDVMNAGAQKRNGFKLESLSVSTQASFETLSARGHGQQMHNAFEDRLSDNTVTPPPDAAAFRIDFPDWCSTWPQRDRQLIDLLMQGESTLDVAQASGITAGRVSQKRREFHDGWLRFHGDDLVSDPTTATEVAVA